MTSNKANNDSMNLIEVLRRLHSLLEEEKEALINNNVDKISEIVEEKIIQIERLEDYKEIEKYNNNKEVVDLIKDINSLQELNMLMTRQAISYQNVLIENISKSVYNLTNTYSSQGKYETTNKVSIIDQSV